MTKAGERIIEGLKSALAYAKGDKSRGTSVIVRLRKKDFEKFVRELDNPPEPNENLRNSLRSKAPWETE